MLGDGPEVYIVSEGDPSNGQNQGMWIVKEKERYKLEVDNLGNQVDNNIDAINKDDVCRWKRQGVSGEYS